MILQKYAQKYVRYQNVTHSSWEMLCSSKCKLIECLLHFAAIMQVLLARMWCIVVFVLEEIIM